MYFERFLRRQANARFLRGRRRTHGRRTMATRAVFSAMTTTGAKSAPVVTGHRRGGRRATTHKVRMTARNGRMTTRCLKSSSSFAISMRLVRRVTREDGRGMGRGTKRRCGEGWNRGVWCGVGVDAAWRGGRSLTFSRGKFESNFFGKTDALL